MSESISTIIKILSSLTSVKAAVKYISVGVFMLLTWKYLNGVIDYYDAPSEYRNFIILSISLGSGTLFGHLISFVITQLSIKFKAKKNKKEAEKKQAEEDKEVLDQFKMVYKHYDQWKREIIRKLSIKDTSLEWRDEDVDVLQDNGYIVKVANIDRDKNIYKLHSALVDFITSDWEKEVDNNLQEFFTDYDDNKKQFIELLEYRNRDRVSSIMETVIDIFIPYPAIFKLEAEDDVGFYITVEQPYHDRICNKLNIILSDETYILKNRITKAVNVA